MAVTSEASPAASCAMSRRRLAWLQDVEAQLDGLLAKLRQLVLTRRRIEQVGRHGGVHLEAGDVDAER